MKPIQIIKKIFPSIKITESGDWTNFNCILSPWTHKRGIDTHPSMGMHKINPVYNCFACGNHGHVGKLLSLYGRYSGIPMQNYIALLDEAGIDVPTYETRFEQKEVYEPIPNYFIDVYEIALNHPYLVKRNISNEIIDLFQIRWFPEENRIMIPVRSQQHELLGFVGRTIIDASPKSKNFFLKKKFSVFGINQLMDNYVIVTEGIFDALRLIQYGYPAVSVLGAQIHENQINMINELGIPVYFWMDNDKAGWDAVKKYHKDFTSPVFISAFPPGIKDPDELSERQVRNMLKHARIL